MKEFWMLCAKVYQSSAAQQDHEDNKRLKVIVFYDGETGSSHVRPDLPSPVGCIYFQEWTAAVTL